MKYFQFISRSIKLNIFSEKEIEDKPHLLAETKVMSRAERMVDELHADRVSDEVLDTLQDQLTG